MNTDTILRCPECGGVLERAEHLDCTQCRRRYPIFGGIPRFVEGDSYVRSFGFQWNLHRRTQLDVAPGGPSETFLRQTLGLTPERVRGQTVLDAGCGSGRFTEILNRWGANVVAMDLSRAVEACHENLAARGVTVLQADILRPPLAPGSFDVIVSAGVLHHTVDAQAAFTSLVPLLRPGGYIAIWLYHAYQDDSMRMRLSLLYRRVTPRLDPRLLYALCQLSIPWYYLNRVPLVGSLTSRMWHISDHPARGWRVLETFDWYSPRYQSHHTYVEVAQWFEKNGLRDLRVFGPPVAVAGTKL